jgi:hypothetical protein
VFAGCCHRSWCWWNKLLFRQIVSAFSHIWKLYLLNFYIHLRFLEAEGTISGRDLQFRQKWSYTEYGPKKSDIRCSN